MGCCDDDMKLRRIDLDLTTALPKNKAWRLQCSRWTLAPNRNFNQHRSILATFLARDSIASVRFWCIVVPQGTPLGSGNGNKNPHDIALCPLLVVWLECRLHIRTGLLAGAKVCRMLEKSPRHDRRSPLPTLPHGPAIWLHHLIQ
jgi:hypothetical protein